MNAIEINHLSRYFGKTAAVNDLNLSIPSGALFGLIGPNGAGKTTTMRMLAGLLEPSEGEIILNGEQTNLDRQALSRQIGYMPDFFGVYDDMLVWEYLDFFGRCYDLPAAHRNRVVDELLDLVDLTSKKDDYVETLSRGMRQRLCLAHALVHDPQILLLDEPASGLDPRARIEMRELLKELGAMGKTIILSSHILHELAELCDYVGIIEKGTLVVSGNLSEIKQAALQQRTVKINLLELDKLDTAADFLSSYPGVGELIKNNHSIEMPFVGTDEDKAAMLTALINHGFSVTGFTESTSDLEQIFLRLTKGEVA
ncbi:ABC transporter ATP-binding protein [bacterium]|nr:ABC transporter ATP-binding protein [bacterium]